MPGLQDLFYTPEHSYTDTKRLRALHAGDPVMQQRLVRDDRYWTGHDAAAQAPIYGSLALLSSIPYDAAKLAYFHGPEPVKRALASITARMFPGEGFNDSTTSRPSAAGSLALLQGVIDGTSPFMGAHRTGR